MKNDTTIIKGVNAVTAKDGKAVPVGKMGRPKGSRNKVTLLKLIAEEAVRDRNATKIMEVCNLIVDQALEGDRTSQKLVWQSVVSNGIAEERSAVEKVEIKIGSMEPKAVTINQEDITDVE